MTTSSATITGILVPHMVPLDARGRINEDELARYVSWLIDRGVHGLYPNGSTGEFLRFTVEERQRIVQVVCAAAGGRVPVVAGRGRGQRLRDDPGLRALSGGGGSRGGGRVAVLLSALTRERVCLFP